MENGGDKQPAPSFFRGFGGDSTPAPCLFSVLLVKAPTFSGDGGDSSEF
jgi:hypothetical protein